jgi:protein TonB
MDQLPSEDTTPVSQPAGDAISPSKPLVWAQPLVVDWTDIPYPTERGVRPEGTVRLRLRIGIDGQPLEVLLGASSGYVALDRAALKAVAHWRFKPRLLNGQPVESWAEMPIVFRLEN